jgi:hypothetical protein
VSGDVAVGWSALIAAAATVVGAVTLVMFFRRGGNWGLANDISSVVLMLALIPVALLVAVIERSNQAPGSVLIAALGIAGMLVAAAAQALLVLRRLTFEQSKRPVLLAGAVVGVWYVLIGLYARLTPLDGLPAWLAIAAGVGFVAVGYGFLAGNEQHPLSALGGGVLFIASLGFLTILGVRLVTGDIAGPYGNV